MGAWVNGVVWVRAVWCACMGVVGRPSLLGLDVDANLRKVRVRAWVNGVVWVRYVWCACMGVVGRASLLGLDVDANLRKVRVGREGHHRAAKWQKETVGL